MIDQLINTAKKVLGMAPPVPMAVLTREKFIELTGIVIDNFEGGYYHPDMIVHFNLADQAILRASGETMFGLDRAQGSLLSMYPEWVQFWSEIDKADARHKWKHYFMGGPLEPVLKSLCAKIMYQWFSHLAAKYLRGNSIDKIAGDERLIIHMSYACWNGEGWFERFSKAINQAVGSKDQMFNYAIKARTEAVNVNGLGIITGPNKTIRQQGLNMMSLFKKRGIL